MLCAIIQNDTVTQIADLTEDEIQAKAANAEIVLDISSLSPQPQIGWIFSDGKLVSPGGQGSVQSIKITRLAFRNRLSMQEKATLYTVAATPQGLPIKIYLDDLAVSMYIDLTNPMTIAAVQYLESLGLLGVGRAAEVLSTQTDPNELYTGG